MSSYHKSSFIEKLASNFKAIDNILLFRRCHPTLTNSIFTAIVIVIIGVGVICAGAFLKGLELYVFGAGAVLAIIMIYFIWRKPKSAYSSSERYYRSEQENRRRSDYGNSYANRYSSRSNHRGIKIAVILIVIIHLVIVIGGTLKIQPLYNTVQRVIALSENPVQFIEKNFWEHMKVMLANPWQAWHYIFSDEATIYRELMIEYSMSSGIDVRDIEEYLTTYKILE